jgi:hypothetical protein
MAQGGRAAETHFMPHNPSSTNTFFLTSHLSTAESLYLLSVYSNNSFKMDDGTSSLRIP